MTVDNGMTSGLAEAILARAYTATRCPIAVHRVSNDAETRLAGHGACHACAYVTARPRGASACASSRRSAYTAALRQQRCIAFVCHMGFVCVTAPFDDEDDARAVTLGPFCVDGAASTLAHDAAQGLRDLGEGMGTALPFRTDDIVEASLVAMAALAETFARELAALEPAASADAGPEPETEADPEPKPSNTRALPGFYTPPSAATMLVLAVATDSAERVRSVLDERIAFWKAEASTKRPPLQNRLAVLLASVLEAADQAGLETAALWSELPQALAAMRESESEGIARTLALRFLTRLRRDSHPRSAPVSGDVQLHALIEDRLADGLPLSDAAQALGVSASALTKQLQRRFGLSYTGYLNAWRIHEAKGLLARTRLSATEVARRVGIKDQSRFSKLFLRYAGSSPTAYRARCASARSRGE